MNFDTLSQIVADCRRDCRGQIDSKIQAKRPAATICDIFLLYKHVKNGLTYVGNIRGKIAVYTFKEKTVADCRTPKTQDKQRGKKLIEKQIEEYLKRQVEKRNGKALKFTSPGNSGVPDRLVLLPGGRLIFVETKRPKGGIISARQKYIHKTLRSYGQQVEVVATKEEIDELLKKEDEKEKQWNLKRTITKDT